MACTHGDVQTPASQIRHWVGLHARTEACGTPLVARSLLPGTGSQTGHCFGVTDGRSKGALNSDYPLSTCQMRRPKRPLWGGRGRYRGDVGAHRSLGSWLSVRLGLGVLVPSAHVSPGASTRSHKEHNLPAVHAGMYAIPKWHPCPSHIPPQCTCIPCSTHTLHIASPPLHIHTFFLLQPRKWGKEAEARQWLQDGVKGGFILVQGHWQTQGLGQGHPWSAQGFAGAA